MSESMTAVSGAPKSDRPAQSCERGDLADRIALSLLAEPADEEVGSWVAEHGAREAVARVLARKRPGHLTGPPTPEQLRRAVTAQEDRARSCGARALIPGDPEWPSQLDDLGVAAPLLLWCRGGTLRKALLRSVAIVGARACTGYGRAQAEQLAADLGMRGWTVVSGGAFGIDAAAHRGALAVAAPTILVSAAGVDRCYPRSHEGLYERVVSQGCVVSEAALGTAPMKHRFLKRNRLIAALTRGTIVVEAALRSGASATATAAHDLNRHVMAVPGPVSSDMSAGCHRLIRDGAAVLVSHAGECLELVTPLGEEPAQAGSAGVLRWMAVHGPSAAAEIATAVEQSHDEVLALLTRLEGAGVVECRPRGWVLSTAALERMAAIGA